MVGLGPDDDVVAHVDKPRVTELEWMWGIACWGPRFTELLHRYVQNRVSLVPELERELVLGDIFDAAIAGGLRVKGLPIQDGDYVDVGTYEDLKLAVLKYA